MEKEKNNSQSKLKRKDKLNRFLDYNNYILRNLTLFFYTAFIILGFSQIMSRYILNRSIIWGEQMSRFMFVWSVFLGAALVIGEGEHIALSFFTEKYPKRISQYINILKMIIILIVVIWVFVIDGFKIAKVVHQQLSPAVDIPMSIPYSSIFFGGILMSLNILIKLVKELKKLFFLGKGENQCQ